MAEYLLLEKIQSPDDVKRLPAESLPILADEIRSFLVESVSETGGHLASNLGVVELSVALARVFSTPHDHIVWDVGHQSYVYKLLTGRRDRFDTLRQSGGLCGFTKRTESEHDCFGAGHSSTSISAALGFAEADRLAGSDAYSVAVMGDGAFTGGMIHEALNNCRGELRLIIIVNENEMSISRNIGRFAESLSKLRLRRGYFRSKKTAARILEGIPLLGRAMLGGLKRVKRLFKNQLYGSNYFEKMGLYYLGPADGNDMEAVEQILRLAKQQTGNVVVHLKTKKGKGYAPAERDPDRYHALAAHGDMTKCGFSRTFGDELCHMASEDGDICDITAAIKDNASLATIAIELNSPQDADRAFRYIGLSFEDADFYNSKLRRVQIASSFPMIEKAYADSKARQEEYRKRSLFLISSIAVLLAVFCVLVVRLFVRDRATAVDIKKKNEQLLQYTSSIEEAEDNLRKTNLDLIEANAAKEEYLGLFLSMCSGYLDKLKKTISREQYEAELRTFYKTFDTSFLQLYPNFVEDFNALLRKESRIVLKEGELLNTELRIFALIKLGITQSSHIASLLRYSVNTIYNYRAQVKNSVLENREDFEEAVRKIGSKS